MKSLDAARVNDVMNPNVLCIEVDTSLVLVQRIFTEDNLDCLPVVAPSGEPLGLLTRGALAARGLLSSSSASRDALPLEVASLMQKPVFVLLESAPLYRGAAILATEHADSLVVISQHGLVVGTLSTADVSRHVARLGGFVLA
jgi:CBS domain-containing protein